MNYSRGVQYTQGFTDPFFSDYVTVAVSGFVSDRSRATLSAGYNTGSVGVRGCRPRLRHRDGERQLPVHA